MAVSALVFWTTQSQTPDTNVAPGTAFDDTEAQLLVRRAASTDGAAARKVEALQKAPGNERNRVIQTDSGRDLNQTAIKTLEQQLRVAEARNRDLSEALKLASPYSKCNLSALRLALTPRRRTR